MKGTNLGEFEELLLLTVASLYPEAYGVAIREELKSTTGRAVVMGAIHSSLNRLVEKGFLSAELAPGTHPRGGRRKRLFTLTHSGKEALEHNRSLRNSLWDKIPQLSWNNVKYEAT
ncbi:PadR family transcriptional regulator [Ekhidna sp. To15]|uniref:PadR family transcriptional regulator n=1 Tax=Ekhidna sp. To15 TaxID=3395267 RepID=UPI003F520D8E